ncbi:MAG TPA: metallophosphoesterase family protein, partial [Anaerolineales bacterium]|nr:metallophosphoesterase family protein [Anaerolineales bacterium]
MKKSQNSLIVFPAILLIAVLIIPGPIGIAAPAQAGANTPSPTPVRTINDTGDVPSAAEDEPVHMPDLIGQTLEYATSIWDNDEPLPQIRLQGVPDGPNVFIVRQQPAPGTLIHPSEATLVLTLGRGPVARTKASPTPAPSPSLLNTTAGTATLLRPPYIQNLTTTEVTIVWTTVQDGASEVDYGIGNTNLTASATSTFVTTPATAPYNQYFVHQATLSGLTPDTIYQYKIFTNGADLTPGGVVTFRSGKPASSSTFRFAVIGDSGDGSTNQRDVATRLLQVQPDLVVHTGDMVYSEMSYSLVETRYFNVYKDLLKSVWLAPTMGNHDVQYNNGKSFTDVFVNPPNATYAPEKELYYSFDYGNAHYVILDNYFSMNTVGSPQYNWLKNDLANSNQFWKFVFFHVPAYASSSTQSAKNDAATVRNLVPLFEQYNVDIVFNGHWHDYERMYPLKGGNVSTVDAGGVVYLVTGGGGAGLISIGTGTLNPHTAAKYKKFHFTMIDMQGCSLKLSAVQKVSSASDTFDPSDVFDSYTLNRCNESTPTPTSTGGATSTPTPTYTSTNTAGPTNTSTPTNTPGPTATPTNTPTLGPTATPTNTPTNTPTAGPTNTPTPTSAVTDLIFKDGFESGNLSAWTASSTNGGNLSVSANSALSGIYGLKATFTNTTTMFVRDDSPNAEPRYRARFSFDPNS